MKKHLKFAGKCAVFICILCFCIRLVYQIITPKYFYQEMLQTTLAYSDFYNMEENTIDVLFLGSSLAATSYIPQELYNDYGITGYNLGSGKQSPVISYFWLKEALRYQKPAVLVLDCFYFFKQSEGPLNSPESLIRSALDYMKWSSVKREAVKTVCELDESQSVFSYYFPNIRYHARWRELTKDDFSLPDALKYYEFMGYAPLAGNCKVDDYAPFDMETVEEETDMLPLMKEYLDKIVQLCEQEGISLVLTNIPIRWADPGKCLTLQRYADEHDLLFLDFNEKNLYEETGFDFAADSSDSAHANIWGAKKLTDYIGEVLASRYHIGGRVDGQWENARKAYEEMQKDCGLVQITDMEEYITALQDDRYSVFISAKGFYASYLKDETILGLRGLGLQVDLQTDPSKESFYDYFAVLSGGRIEEYIGYDERTYSNSIRNGLVTFDITGTGSIMIEGVERSMDRNGLNIVVYNNDTNKIIDSVCFDTTIAENTVSR